MQTVPIVVADWPDDPDNPSPPGSQPKVLLVSPENLMSPDLIPGHRYLFKTPDGWQAYQVWSELLAYHISRLTGVSVPRCCLGVDGEGRLGVVVEYFYGYPRMPNEERFVHGSDLLQRALRDKKRGRPHGVRSNVRLTDRYGVTQASIAWGRMLVFDALIGNSDRHPDNWDLVYRYEIDRLPDISLAPAFDNAISLGHEFPEARVEQRWSESQLRGYIRRGRHHCGWSAADDTRGEHVALCVRFADAFPEALEPMRRVVRFHPSSVDNILAAAVAMRVPTLPFSEARSQFVRNLILMRQQQLADALGA